MTDNNSNKQQINYFKVASTLFDAGVKIYDKIAEPELSEDESDEPVATEPSVSEQNNCALDTEHDDQLNTEHFDSALDTEHDDQLNTEHFDSALDTEHDDQLNTEHFDSALDTIGTIASGVKNYVQKNLNTKKAVHQMVKDMISDVDPEITTENSDQVSSLMLKYFDEHYNINEIGDNLITKTLKKVDVETVIAKNISVGKIVKTYAKDNWSSIAILFSVYLMFQYILFYTFSLMHL